MKDNVKILIFSITICLCLFGCKQREVGTSNLQDTVEIAEIVEDTPDVKDSIDILIEQRASAEYTSTIFAGLKFGDTQHTVERVLSNSKNREVLVPNGNTVSSIHFSSIYDATYYNGQLASITLYAEEDEYIDPLVILFTTKYGKTKKNIWDFSNCSMRISIGVRSLYDPSYDAGYGHSNGTRMYYDCFGGRSTNYLTKDPYFLKLTYSNENLLNSIRRQNAVRDSLKNVEQNTKAKQEAELAKKLATEVSNSI